MARPERDPRRPDIPTIALTDLTVRHLKPVAGKRITYLDRSLKGFGVMIMPAGHASYVLTYGPDRRRIKLGDVGIVKLADAREQARQRLARYQLGQEVMGVSRHPSLKMIVGCPARSATICEPHFEQKRRTLPKDDS